MPMLKLQSQKVVILVSELYWLNPFFERPDPEPILREAFNWTSYGIFKAIYEVADDLGLTLPWDEEDSETLDLAYFGNHSGGKFCSPVVKLLLETTACVDEHGQLNETGADKLAQILLRKYITNWTRLWDTNVVAYDPVTNYDMRESRNLLTSDSSVRVDAGTQTGTTETTYGKTSDETDYKYGLNTDSQNVKPSEKISIDDGGSDSTERDLADSRSSNIAGAGEEVEETHRVGNIGVTTNQKLVQEERDLWLWNYFDQIFKDLDRELALAIHDPCRV